MRSIKRYGLVAVLVMAVLFMMVPPAAEAGAAAKRPYYPTTIKWKGTTGYLEATPPFQSFANFNKGDCQYETAANLILAQWPTTKITTAEVVAAWREYGINYDPNGNGLEAGQEYFINYGFAGHRASALTTITGRAAIIYAANHGGVEVSNLGPYRAHMFAMIRANAKMVTLVDDGFVYHYTWKWFVYADSQDPSQPGMTLTYQAVTWAQ